MDPFWQIVIAFVGGGLVGGFTFAQFLIKRHDEKAAAKDEGKQELTQHGKQLEELKGLIQESLDEQRKTQKQVTDQGEAIAGLEHDRIVHIGEGYIKQGYIPLRDYDDINNYLFIPYQKLGGNGTAEDIMNRLQAIIQTDDGEKK